ncbi:MAG: beta-lactamase family protein [Lentimicrobiaceae bacterium]|nr:beta-lactamase family protein [Lentimicrobiaceae bacterium]MCL2246621.1 beta-lactamase family protein [Lentimicrobiaceae bacterium]
MKRVLILSLAVSLVIFSGFSQSIDKEKLDTYFDALASNNRFMGSVAIAQGDKLIYSKSVGFADVEQGLTASERSKYRIGSITKTFTAVLILKAVEEGMLSLSETIDKYFPTIGNANKITIEHLLRHRSGLHNHLDEFVNSNRHTQPIMEKEMMEVIIKGGNDFEPDTKMAYSNPNYILLTYILEKIYEKPFSKIVEDKITNQLGLENTYLDGKINTQNGECNSYTFLNNSWVLAPELDVSQALGAGAMTSTPTDLVKFSCALFNGKLISENSLTKMKTIKDHLGMGLIKMPFYDKTGFGHTGGIDGFSSVFAYFTTNEISFAYTANGMNFNGNDISIAILNAAFNNPFEIPEFTILNIADEELDKYLGVYSSLQLPLKLTITKNNGLLFAQLTGQPSFPLEATAKDKFEFKQADAVFEFNPLNKALILKQRGMEFLFERE